ncbi:hypothetical protein ACFQXA_15570 [Nocardiopsis composta]
MPEFAMPGFPEAFRAHTERAHLRPITLALAHVKGPGAAVVYDTANHAFLANVPGEPAPWNPTRSSCSATPTWPRKWPGAKSRRPRSASWPPR